MATTTTTRSLPPPWWRTDLATWLADHQEPLAWHPGPQLPYTLDELRSQVEELRRELPPYCVPGPLQCDAGLALATADAAQSARAAARRFLAAGDANPAHVAAVQLSRTVERGASAALRHWLDCYTRARGLLATWDPDAYPPDSVEVATGYAAATSWRYELQTVVRADDRAYFCHPEGEPWQPFALADWPPTPRAQRRFLRRRAWVPDWVLDDAGPGPFARLLRLAIGAAR